MFFFFENNNNFMEFTFALEPNKVNTQLISFQWIKRDVILNIDRTTSYTWSMNCEFDRNR